ncbi:hypothetical protein ACI1US_00379 [Leucobacter sp. BZR 635]|uniref:hypothetical protein n=1 Tax=Leucobacter sp. BZR 635 TaxID=3378705 RepID=UPI003A8C66E9
MPNPPKPKGFFPISKYRLYSTIGILVVCVLSINPYTFYTQVSGTALINWLLIGIMLLALVVMVVDLLITPSDDLKKTESAAPEAAHTESEAR